MILVNFKIYKETFGDNALNLAKICKETADKYKIRIVVAASSLDAVRIKDKTGAEVWLQEVDEYSDGKHTGRVSMEQAMDLGIKGSLINHSENQLPRGTVQKIIKNRPKGFELVCCVKSLGQIERWVALAKPDWILYEPPELIASTDKSVATEKPKAIENAVKLCLRVPLMVGAGVKSRQDVETSLKMGARAVGLASAFVLAANPKKLLENLAEGFISV
jgi:triosephosphate isomerase